jgi:SAM-dependent methyltransferase
MPTTETFRYIGEELETFAHAQLWKSYVHAQVSPFFGPTVLEVGAGLGVTTEMLRRDTSRRWVCLEPDETLAIQMRSRFEAGPLLSSCEIVVGKLDSLSHDRFDTILYVDVLEHIENDRSEVAAAATMLRPGGRLIVLSPAFPFLYCGFDRALGHFRRYTKTSLKIALCDQLRVEHLRYLDAAGFFASAANRFFMHKSHASVRQVVFWDRTLIPISRIIDPLIFYAFGRSVLGVFRRDR